VLKNYITVAFRNLKRHKGYSFINIAGLAVGMACCLLIFLYVRHELGYDRYHDKADRIWRVTTELVFENGFNRATTPAPLGPAMAAEFQEIESVARFMKAYDIADKILVSRGPCTFYEDKWLFADASVFDVFSFPLLRGNPKTALQAPLSVAITESVAGKYFGTDDPMGKVLTVLDRHKKTDYLVTGILKDIPKNSHFRFDFLAAFSSLDQYEFNLSNWFNIMYYTYAVLKKESRSTDLENKFPGLVKKYTGYSVMQLHLQPLASIHLHSQLGQEIEPNSDVVYVYVLSAIALLILLIACANFINLTTSQSAARAKEVGLRKVVGANRRQLVTQFLGESVFLMMLALCVALILIEIILPGFNVFTGKDIGLIRSVNLWLIAGLVGITLLVGLASGAYPAFILSVFDPVQVIKRRRNPGGKKSFLRRGLIVFQFAISAVLIISTIIVGNQMHYARSKKLGFHKEQVVVLPLWRSGPNVSTKALKNEFLKNPRVLNASFSSGLPGRILHQWFVQIEGVDSLKAQAKPSIAVLMVDHDFVKTMGLKLAEGRDFSERFISDEQEAVLLNEAAVEAYGLKSPIGLKVKTENKSGIVIGILKDFHFASLHQRIEPLIMYIAPRYFNYLSIRISPGDIPASLAFLKEKWEVAAPGQPFEYFFLDADFQRFYRSEEKLGRLFGCSSLLAVIVACLGLFALVSYSAERQTKEIGIRRILGASLPGLVLSLTKQFFKLVLIANLVAWPVAYYAMNRWLQRFAYRTSIGLGTFVLAAAIVFVIAGLTVSAQAVKAALANPVDSLKYE
jgi:putative ABC transport system permease protein